MNDDDDLPILTHVLRTGIAPPTPPRAVDDPDAVFGAEPPQPVRFDLSIGVDPAFGSRQAAEAPASSTERAASRASVDGASSDIVADPRQTVMRDRFTTLGVADDELEFPGTIEPIDEPELVTGTHDGSPVPVALDTPFDFSAPPDTTALARRIRQAVLDDLSTRIGTELDARIAQALRSEVETALSRLQENLRNHLTDALGDIVARAVDAEIARMTWSATTGLPH